MCSLFNSEIFWVALTAFASCASVFVAIYLVKKQLEFSKRDLYIRMQLILEDKFNSKKMREARKGLAQQILDKEDNSELWETTIEFFELQGLLLRKKSLDPEMIWGTFSFYSLRWWEHTKTLIEYLRTEKDDITLYEDFENLVKEMYKWDVKRRGKNIKDVIPSKSDLEQFLHDEADLE